MKLADESYTMILVFFIVAIILSIIILICFKYHDVILRLCKNNRVSPETVYTEKPLEIKPV
jgi:hypothetical protein